MKNRTNIIDGRLYVEDVLAIDEYGAVSEGFIAYLNTQLSLVDNKLGNWRAEHRLLVAAHGADDRIERAERNIGVLQTWRHQLIRELCWYTIGIEQKYPVEPACGNDEKPKAAC
jgi:hypothetical protein